jgi:hypothetical protein
MVASTGKREQVLEVKVKSLDLHFEEAPSPFMSSLTCCAVRRTAICNAKRDATSGDVTIMAYIWSCSHRLCILSALSADY